MANTTTVETCRFGRLHRPASAGAGKGASHALGGIVLIHDVWGLSEHSDALARDLAAEGFAVLEIDLYREMGEVEIEAPGPFIRRLVDAEILADLDAASAWLADQPSVTTRHAVVGVCMGGTYALLAACRSERFAAAAPFYGILSYDAGLIGGDAETDRDFAAKPVSPIEAAPELRMPLLASFGAEDDFVPPGDLDALRQALVHSSAPSEVDVYPDAGHAFLNRTRPDAFRPAASEAAWTKLIPFLRSNLEVS